LTVIYPFGPDIFMVDNLNQFTWFVAATGYHWQKLCFFRSDRKEPQVCLCDNIPVGVSADHLLYNPMRIPGLFLQFAELDQTEDGIEHFANEFGLLTKGETVVLQPASTVGNGETFDFWVTEISLMRRITELWLALRDNGESSALDAISWQGDSLVRYDSQWIASKQINPEVLATLRPGDRRQPARLVIQRTINQKLEGVVSPQLLWADSSHQRLSLYQRPHNLLAAMWLQFARALDGDRTLVRCQACRNYFEVDSPDGGRKDKQFCGSACRARDWRKRKMAERSETARSQLK
jgi:hypothetical protein